MRYITLHNTKNLKMFSLPPRLLLLTSCQEIPSDLPAVRKRSLKSSDSSFCTNASVQPGYLWRVESASAFGKKNVHNRLLFLRMCPQSSIQPPSPHLLISISKFHDPSLPYCMYLACAKERQGDTVRYIYITTTYYSRFSKKFHTAS